MMRDWTSTIAFLSLSSSKRRLPLPEDDRVDHQPQWAARNEARFSGVDSVATGPGALPIRPNFAGAPNSGSIDTPCPQRRAYPVAHGARAHLVQPRGVAGRLKVHSR